MSAVPAYLRGYESLYLKDPKAAAIDWHRNAKWGLFVHYALASLRGLTAEASLKAKDGSNADWKKLKQGTPEEFLKLKEQFTAEKFNADLITDLAQAAEMRYVNFTTRHLGDLYMFRTSVSDRRFRIYYRYRLHAILSPLFCLRLVLHVQFGDLACGAYAAQRYSDDGG